MPENPFKPHTKIEQSDPTANEKVIGDLFGKEDARAYAELHSKVLMLEEDVPDVALSDEEKRVMAEKQRIRVTPEEIITLLQESGSKAELDASFEGGIVSIDIPSDITDWPSAEAVFKGADNGSASSTWSEWGKGDWSAPKATHLDIIVLSYSKDPETRRSSEKAIADMDRLGFRPLTLEEMIIAGALEPKFTKTKSRYFVSLTKYEVGRDSFIPSLYHNDGIRTLYGNAWYGTERSDWLRFLCVRK